MFESAIYLGEQHQPVPNMDSLDRVRTYPDLGELVANPSALSARYTPGVGQTLRKRYDSHARLTCLFVRV
jgi:hypothetical protein